MGQTGTKVASKLANSFSFAGTLPEDEHDSTAIARFKGGTPLVYSRRG